MSKNTGRKKHVKILIIALIIMQGLYVIFPLPDIWPFSNYSMFSRANPATVVSSFEFYGLASDGREIPLNHGETFSPFDRVRLKKGINRILNREYFIHKQEKRLESVFKRLRFLPVNHIKLKETIRRLLPYKKDTADVAVEEKELRILFDYLLAQYEYNRGVKLHSGPPIVSMNLYVTKWDWTDMPPEEVLPETKLVYSTEYGLVENE